MNRAGFGVDLQDGEQIHPTATLPGCHRRDLNPQGVIRGKPHQTTIPDNKAPCPLDKVNRQFRVPAPNMLWVSGFTCVAI